MPSRLSWLVMGGPTAHPTGVTLASGDPSNSLIVRWGGFGSRPQAEVAPGFVLEAVRERWRALAGKGGTGGQDGPDSWRRNILSLHRGSSGEVVDPFVSEEDGRIGVPHYIPGRGGEREREQVEAVEWLQWQERAQLPKRWQG